MIRTRLAVAVGSLVARMSRLLGRGGSALPGLVAEKIDPNVVARLGSRFERGVVMVTGTNGKTTTTKLLSSILKAAGARLVTNRTGSNMSRGVASLLIDTRRVDADLAVLEVDEAALPSLAARLDPVLVVVTNLSRDQLDRYGELATTARLVGQGVAAAQSAILNADDPLVAALGEGRSSVVTFGADDAIRSLMPHDAALHGGESPPRDAEPDVVLVAADGDADGQRVGISLGPDDRIDANLALPGVYNAYNATAAAAAARALGADRDAIVAGLEAVEPAFGRGQVIDHRDRSIRLLLVKNPAGFNQVIRLLSTLPEARSCVIAINDNHADGRDVSWLWDAAVEELASTDHRFATSGIRAADMALRLKYAGVEAGWAESDFDRALDRLVADSAPGEEVVVVPTYTAMLELLHRLQPDVPREEAWT